MNTMALSTTPRAKRGDYGGQPGRCQWLDGEPASRQFCGCRTVTASAPYCAEHARRAYAVNGDAEGISQ